MIFTSKLKSFKKIEMKIPLVVLRTPPEPKHSISSSIQNP